jgi:THO complex subunit 2
MTEELLKSRCEPELLEAVGVIEDEQAFQRKVVKVKTQLMFTQSKYNLLREESEGYSKVVTVLCQRGITVDTAAGVYERILALIGYFDLDPNRCFDLILEAYEQHLSNGAYMELIKLFKPSHACMSQILGFKFQLYANTHEKTPSSLYQLTAMMIRRKLLRVEDVYVHLTPTDEEARDHEQLREKAMQAQAASINTVKLAESSASARAAEEKAMKLPPDLHNQKLGLLESLLSEDLASAEKLFQRIEFMRPAAYPAVAEALSVQLKELFLPLFDMTDFAKVLSQALPTAKAARKQAKKAADKAAAVAAATTGEDAMEVDIDLYPWATLEERAVPLVRYLGCYMGKDVPLFTMICRTLAHYGALGLQSDEHREQTQSVLEQVVQAGLMPGLTLVPSNPGCASELWNVMKLLPYSSRFQIYGSLQLATSGDKQSPELVLAKAKTKSATKQVLSRISNDTFKQQGRSLGKLSHSNPLVVFERVISTVKMMPNIISALVDSLRYICQLAFDALTYLLIEGLSDPTKSRLKADGQNLADWLTALAELAGSVARRYPHIELGAIMKYVGMQMISDNSHDLIVLRKIIGQMTGIEAIEDLTSAQLVGQTGGPTLRAETNQSSAVNAKSSARTARRLKDAAVDSKMALPLLLLTGQQTGSSVFNAEFRQLKLIGEVYDKCHETVQQLVMFLSTAMGKEAYAHMLPSLQDLVKKHCVEPEVAFFISRPVLEQKCGGATAVLDAVRDIMPTTTWDLISPQLYATFWSLSLYELDMPKDSYDEALAKQRTELEKLPSDRSLSHSQLSKKKKEKQGIIDKLLAEKRAQKKIFDDATSRLKAEAPSWIVKPANSDDATQAEGLTRIMQCCIFPRVIFSQLDAVYCAKFVQKMHEVKTPYFSVLLYYDKVIKLLAPAFHCCTFNEASRLGRFMAETLRLLEYWRGEAATYRRECQQHPGFKKSLIDPKAMPISYIEFVRVNHKWHVRLMKMFAAGLEQAHDTDIRNSLIILRMIVGHFPAVKTHYKQIEKRVQALENDERQDIKMMAMAYRAQLKKREQYMVTDEQFRREKAKPPPKASPKPPSKPETSSGKSNAASSAGSPPAPSSRLKPPPAKQSRLKPPPAHSPAGGDDSSIRGDGKRQRGLSGPPDGKTEPRRSPPPVEPRRSPAPPASKDSKDIEQRDRKRARGANKDGDGDSAGQGNGRDKRDRDSRPSAADSSRNSRSRPGESTDSTSEAKRPRRAGDDGGKSGIDSRLGKPGDKDKSGGGRGGGSGGDGSRASRPPPRGGGGSRDGGSSGGGGPPPRGRDARPRR